MQEAPQDETFVRGIDAKRKPALSADSICGVLFYLSALAQVILCFATFAAKNAEIAEFDSAGYVRCPDGMVWASNCASVPLYSTYTECISRDLCDQVAVCVGERRLGEAAGTDEAHANRVEFLEAVAATEGPYAENARRLLAGGHEVPKSLWDFLETHFYVPTLLLGGVFLAASLWLLALQKFPRSMIWGTIGADIVLLLAGFAWFKLEADTWNPALAIVAGLTAIAAVFFRTKIDQCSVVMKAAMDGLVSNRRVFLVCASVTCLWAAFFAMWVAALIGMSFVKEVVQVPPDEYTSSPSRCELQEVPWLASGWTKLFFFVNLYWTTYFFRNVNLIVVSSTVSGWYFNSEGYQSLWIQALRWGFVDLAGGNAIASATMGCASYLLSRIKGPWSMALAACLNPVDWILMCIAFALQHVLHAFTKFGLISQVYSGRPFCDSAFAGMKLLKRQLGTAVLIDYIGTRVMSWATYVVALCVACATWAWADHVQGVESITQIPLEAMIFVMLVFAGIIAMPFYCLVAVIWLEVLLRPWGSSGDPFFLEIRAVLNAVFAALFLGAVVHFTMDTVSQIVVNAMDTIFFCFAVETQHGDAKQERFMGLYDNMKATIAPGALSQDAVVGVLPCSQLMQVMVPEGAGEGFVLRVPAPQGHSIEVIVPAGFAAGSVMTLTVPNDTSQPPIVHPPLLVPCAQTTRVVGSPQAGNAVTNSADEAEV
ncbi:unnamed protein product [Prorocentrum cordatum]|uniref:Choline transporter-like protein n=1 Tax=Prorocentrum cordatum TaxID=2364126 RepID=A0ABN9SHA1_9DINO|nr:unnamed protein product [Polarella glacialis]